MENYSKMSFRLSHAVDERYVTVSKYDAYVQYVWINIFATWCCHCHTTTSFRNSVVLRHYKSSQCHGARSIFLCTQNKQKHCVRLIDETVRRHWTSNNSFALASTKDIYIYKESDNTQKAKYRRASCIFCLLSCGMFIYAKYSPSIN